MSTIELTNLQTNKKDNYVVSKLDFKSWINNFEFQGWILNVHFENKSNMLFDCFYKDEVFFIEDLVNKELEFDSEIDDVDLLDNNCWFHNEFAGLQKIGVKFTNYKKETNSINCEFWGEFYDDNDELIKFYFKDDINYEGCSVHGDDLNEMKKMFLYIYADYKEETIDIRKKYDDETSSDKYSFYIK